MAFKSDSDLPCDPTGSILVIGGYGGFGSLLSRRLAAAGHQVIVAGRSARRAKAFAVTLDGAEGVGLDTGSSGLAAALGATSAKVVVDAAGPFQRADPVVARAAIAAGIHYCDLADARDFVCTFDRLNQQAKARSVIAIAGGSSVPALSGAVVQHLAQGMNRVASVDIAISASNRGGAGRSVALAMLSYAGRAIAVWRGGRRDRLVGWRGLHWRKM